MTWEQGCLNLPEPLHPWTFITQKPLTPSGASRMDIISVRRRRKRNPLDVLILSPLAQINRPSETRPQAWKTDPRYLRSSFFSEWKLDESFTEMSMAVTLHYVALMFRLKDLNLRWYVRFFSFNMFYIDLRECFVRHEERIMVFNCHLFGSNEWFRCVLPWEGYPPEDTQIYI